MEYAVCNKCNTVINKYRIVGRGVKDKNAYVRLEFICKCNNVINKHIALDKLEG